MGYWPEQGPLLLGAFGSGGIPSHIAIGLACTGLGAVERDPLLLDAPDL